MASDLAAPTATGPTDRGSATSSSPVRRAGLGLLSVALLFLVVQLVLVPRPFGLSVDEANYLAKVDPAVPELNWTAPRAWGMPVLAAPVAFFSVDLAVIRLYFGVLASAGLAAAFWPWLRVLHPAAAPLAALLFSTTWFTVFFGSELMPNLYVALGAVGLGGLFLRSVQLPTWWRTALVGMVSAFIALVRPTDSVLVVAPLVIGALLVPRLRRPASLAAVIVGCGAGWLPWVVEAFARFGGPLTRLEVAETTGPQGLGLNLSGLLTLPRLLDGNPTYCCYGGPPSDAGPVPILLTLWLLAVTVAALVGVAFAARQHRLPEMLVVCLPAGLLAAFYLLLPSFLTMRFLLPVFALLALPVATAVVSLIAGSRGRWRSAAVAVITVGVLTHIIGMLAIAEHALDHTAARRNLALQNAAALRPLIAGRPCLVVGVQAQTTAFYARCRVQGASARPRPPERVRTAQAEGRFLVALLSTPPDPDSYLASWREVEVPGLVDGFQAYLPPAQSLR
ncbi:MAG: Permease of the drug/metabolite transporter (DMT) superfamily [uncultured Friedmanniella sp.]|uniref:Permease of the drug/metabolite transporter (DMT) superfamily n=1 Tax=uncultured Friedmanniella sp. TaxID=335381 RepID=A0A6J4KFX2_9ACTN|nr:hypothetical protein [uncultured Friedmanniella sp.]CAA9304882.1 MAG: Permease of the drug/metabolite transporter (DMT) superfamily [uncultured Friedmanniella sp.]